MKAPPLTLMKPGERIRVRYTNWRGETYAVLYSRYTKKADIRFPVQRRHLPRSLAVVVEACRGLGMVSPPSISG